ncbi:UNVERIFIED_CONTAM: Thylakoid membrane protein TERC, chloroplastic [Sesamum radiatum]|uniref:Thylakoid membrane protein TERC, chloroplastic n=1 Tax=Sesamum radiatum TaxID=300843 RepID=A0AAW2R594_SESRA
MKLATAMHTNSFQIPFNFDFNLLKSSPITGPKNVPARFVFRSSHPLLSGGCSCARKYYNSIPVFSGRVLRGSAERSSVRHNYSTITCARRTEREQDASTSPKEASKQTRLQSPDGIDETESLCDDNSSAISGEATTRTADYASSLRTVALCLFSAVAFGVGLGFKDGVGKASEFFAGYLLEQSLSVDNLFVFVLIFKYFQVPFSYQATPLLLTVAVIELSDIAFAVDSIPAVFGVTRDPFIVFSSNLFAILGLRSYYTLISESMADLEYLQPAIAVVLGFIGCKMILDFFGFHISTEVSLGLVATTLASGVLLSIIKKSD